MQPKVRTEAASRAVPAIAAPVSTEVAAPTLGSLGLSRRRLVVLGAVCGIVGIAGWAFYPLVFSGDPGQDWMVFYTAARSYFEGHLPVVFDGHALTLAINRRFADWLAFTLNLHPWVYPPIFLLLFLPFGLLPPVLSLVLFLASGFAAMLAATLLFVGPGPARVLVRLSLLLCPAVPFNVMTGQNAFFTTALLVAGFGVLQRAPAIAGIFLGIVVFKPQFWLLVPVALAAARQWRVLAISIATGALLAAVSLAVFGIEMWHAWFDMMRGADLTYREWVVNGRLNGVSVFASATWLGAPAVVANLLQGLALAFAATAVYWTYRQTGCPQRQLAVLLAATLLGALHASASDAVLLAVATVLFVVAPRREPMRTGPLVLAAAVWASPLFNPPSLFRPGTLTPLLVALMIAALISEIRSQTVPPAAFAPAAGA